MKKIQLEEANARVSRQAVVGIGGEIPAWVAKVGELYMQQQEQDKPSAVEDLLNILEKYLGIQPDGSLDLLQAWESKGALSINFDKVAESGSADDSWRYYLKDRLSLIGFNYLYFELCVKHKDRFQDRFQRYFENGFYANRSLFSRNSDYYKSLYFYLYLVTPQLSNKLNRATVFLNKHPNQVPRFMTAQDMRRFELAVWASSELDLLISQKLVLADPLYEKVFSEQDLTWLADTIDYFLSTSTHTALLSYPWLRRHIPLTVGAGMVSHNIARTWEEQAVIDRSRLPLIFFGEKGSARISIERIFGETLEKLRLDNRKVDIMVLSALEAWLSKQVQRGIRIEDRKKYNRILAELKVCPTGWVFANLYDCRSYLAELKSYADNWSRQANPARVFETEVMDTFFRAKEKIDSIFSDLEKIYGKEEKAGRINYIFYKYRGEINYYFKFIQFETFGEKGGFIPAAGPEANYLKDFKTAFVAYPEGRQNHVNLLKGYNLLFRRLYAGGRIAEIRTRHQEMNSLINGRLALGEGLAHQDNDLYDIYRIITYAYLSSDSLKPRALETARQGFQLAREYYVRAAEKAGYSVDGHIGAITRDNTEMDDYQRQFELYRSVARKLGKKIQLLVPENDVQLYNRMQEMRF
ncbi:MAG: hypothetical protein ACLFS7_06145 [Desulfosudaceae bacterium]